jgi:hypothetical protein
MSTEVVGRGEGHKRYTARGVAPTPEEERALMARFGMEPA